MIIPDDLSKINQHAFLGLITTLNRWDETFPNDRSEVLLYNLDIKDINSKNLLLSLQKKAAAGLAVLIRIPAWDREAYEDKHDCAVKALYREVQNKILDNQRKRRQASLAKNTQSVYAAVDGQLNAEVIIADQDAKKEQPFEGDDILYPLSAQTPGIQQQLQQEVTQEFQQEEALEQEEVHEQEQEQEITQFFGDEKRLISRDNIDSKCAPIWEALAADIKNASGWTQGDLAQLFSLWVGSEKNAAQVIEKIQPQAVQKIMQHAPQFRLGFSKDNLPAGFYLSYSRNKGLILCFDEKREKQDLRARAALALKKRNPFTVQLHPASLENEFKGDFRQFKKAFNAALSDHDALTVWKYLALEDKDSQRINNARAVLNNRVTDDVLRDENIATSIQYFDLNPAAKPITAGDFKDCLEIVKKWVINKYPSLSSALINGLFAAEGTLALTESNLKAFGQLFNFYDIENQRQDNQGTQHFLFLANQIYKKFGADHFAVWKKRFLDSSLNWSELLDKAEIDAYALSMVTLQDKPDYQALWWKLVDMHGAATGHMHYADLWYAFQKVVDLVESKQLMIDKAAFFECLEGNENFQAQVFLDRLYRVLKRVDAEAAGYQIQQDILNHIAQIDWRHNGFYYANQYDDYPYWHAQTKLTGFTASSVDSDEKSYGVKWDGAISADFIELQALRYASQRIRLDFADFNRFRENVSVGLAAIKGEEKSYLITRLYLACIALGVDRVEAHSTTEISSYFTALKNCDIGILQWINQQLVLDANLLTGTLKIRFSDIALLAKTVLENNALPELKKLSSHEAIDFINNCGRAIQCYGVNKDKFDQLIKFVSDKKELAPLLNYYPWLLDDIASGKKLFKVTNSRNQDQLELFEKQLQSIDFSTSTYLPSYAELENAYQSIATAPSPIATRRNIIGKWLEKGCTVSYQDADFRPLSTQESQETKQYLEKNFFEGFKAQNLSLLNKLALHLAVKSDLDCQEQMKNLAKFFVRLDKKVHYNEVGQLIGCLLEKAKTANPKLYYSVPQLISWLSCLMDKNTISQQHYPVDLLNTVLNEAIKNPHASLINASLNKLTAAAEIKQQKAIDRVMRNELPSSCKSTLIKLILQNGIDSAHIEEAEQVLLHLHAAKVSTHWLSSSNQLIEAMAAKKSFYSEVLVRISKTADQVFPDLAGESNDVLTSLWAESQITLIQWLQKGLIDTTGLSRVFTISDELKQPYLQMILTQAVSDTDSLSANPDVINLKMALQRLAVSELKALAVYYAAPPYPAVSLLKRLMTEEKLSSAEEIIHHYESIHQASKADGSSKRHYSLSLEDKESLDRVLQGIKRKGQTQLSDSEQKKLLNLFYYTNSYAEAEQLHLKPMQDLQKILQQNLLGLKNASSDEGKHQSSMRVLACMREILLRKSGKWANHTQMLDLIYAALYNDESLLHQVRTGQGKSIITVMRASYLALTGFVVDVFSAKESLSKRDHEEFAPVLDAMGIQHAYIAESSAAEAYKVASSLEVAGTVGAINYATIGNFSLFQSRHIWKDDQAINLYTNNRVAFLDECDHVLKDEKTQFNYSDSRDIDAVYNLDEWVYRAAYDFYLQNKSSFIVEQDNVYISRDKHLEPLCRYLQECLKQAPKQSTFFQKYIIPALDNNAEVLEKRDQKLKQLLTAAHTAHGLKEGVHFCKRPELKQLAGNTVVHTRFAKVVIDNQIRQGSTYSDLVQQFLHVRLNKEATEAAETPNYFVEPCTEIALSENAPYLLKKYYSKLEGCTGTAGNKHDLETYEAVYGIKHVVKPPSHEVIRTEFLASEFCESEQAQIKMLVAKIIGHNDQPILITCEDDIAVKRIARKINAQLQSAHPDYKGSAIVVDTNDSGKTESQVVPDAGRKGAVTISSRLGRGTDIKPASEKGLMVLRTYATSPRVTKQEYGRQGRNGARGTCQDILDGSVIQKQYTKFSNSPGYKQRLEEIKNEQSAHLNEKIKKHNDKGSEKFAWLSQEGSRENYIKMRSVVQLSAEIKQQQEGFLRCKEFMVASMTGNVKQVLHQYIGKTAAQHAGLSDAWLDSRKKIEAIWNARLTGKSGDSNEVYQEFFDKAAKEWAVLCARYMDLDCFLLLDFIPKGSTAFRTDSLAERAEKQANADLNFWKEKRDRESLSAEDSKELLTLRKDAIKKMRIYHTDKNADYPELIRMLTSLKALIDECLTVITPASVPVDQPAELSNVMETHASKGAVVPYSGLPGQDTAREADRETVINFYQQWLSGVDKYLLREDATLVEAFYTGLDKFYRQLYAASIDVSNNTPVPQQEKNRIALFTGLTEIVQNASAYRLSCSAWSALVEVLSAAGDEHATNYMKFAQRFFSQTWLIQKPASELCKEDMEKHDALLKLTMDIMQTAYVAPDFLQFTDDFTQAVHSHFWDNFSNIKYIEEVFARDPNVTKLLMRHTNKADIAYIINLLAKLDGALDAPRVEQLLSYLEKNAAALEKTPHVIKPLFSICLAPNQEGLSYLPAPDCLYKLPAVEQGNFWHFLSQRLAINQDACEELIRLLNSQAKNPAFFEQSFKPLVNLSAHVPLSYINEHLKFALGKNSLEYCKNNILAIKEAGDALNSFLSQQGIIQPEVEYETPSDPDKKALYNAYLNCFESMSPIQNQMFFGLLAKYSNISHEVRLILAENFANGKINCLALLENSFLLFNDIRELSLDNQNKLRVDFLEILNADPNEIEQSLNHMRAFVSLIKSAKVDSDILSPLFNQRHNLSHNLTWDSIVLKILEQIDSYTRKYPSAKEFMLSYLDSIANRSVHELKYDLEFFEVSNALKGDKVPEMAMVTLCKAYFDNSTAKVNALPQAFAVLCEANQLANDKNYADYFSDFSTKNQGKRQQIMQYLHHGLLNLGDSFSDKCWRYYLDLIQKQLGATPDKISKDQQARLSVTDCFQRLMRVTRELATVARSPFAAADNSVDNAPMNAEFLTQRQQYIASQRARYSSFWFTNKLRKEQANKFFDALESLDSEDSADSIDRVYLFSFKQILQTQRDILQSDSDVYKNKSKVHNKKGYSRLYDITVQMFLRTAHDCLKNDQVSLDTKNNLNDLLQEQLGFQIKILHERLSEHAKLKTLAEKMPAADEWLPSSVELKALKHFIKDQYDNVPKHLRYLLENINNLTQLKDDAPLQRTLHRGHA